MAPTSPSDKMPQKLWEHENPKSTYMWKFLETVNQKHGLQLKDFHELYKYSITRRASFWDDVFEEARFVYECDDHDKNYTVVDESKPIDAVPRWFTGVRLNWAENVLYQRVPGAGASAGERGTQDKPDARIAVTEVREGDQDASQHRRRTWGELRAHAGRLAAAMAARGIQPGDRVMAVAANSIDTLVVVLAAAWLGAIVTTCSTDMGVQGILRHASPTDPKLLFVDDHAIYNGRTIDLRPKITAVVEQLLRQCPSFTAAIAIPRFPDRPAVDLSGIPRTESYAAFLESAGRRASALAAPPPFARLPFHHPLVICFTSGTTGTPKPIVHSIGGLLIAQFKEGRIHEGVDAHTTKLQFTTTGWVMYLVSLAVLQLAGHAIIYDGSPLHPDPGVLLRVAARLGATTLGIGPRWMVEVRRAGIVPQGVRVRVNLPGGGEEERGLEKLRVVTSTGMPLSEELLGWFYGGAFSPRVHLANITGGTDIAGCFGIMNSTLPLYTGSGSQGPSLGVPIAIYDSLLATVGADTDGHAPPGREMPPGELGELVATAAFPNQPVFFWNDAGHVHHRRNLMAAARGPGPDPHGPAPPGSVYHRSYFARYAHTWAHGDFCRIDARTGAVVVLGRADGALNPSGVRFGSADIYAVMERRFSDRVADSLCVGQRRTRERTGGRYEDLDERVVLFLVMRPGYRLDRALVAEVKNAIAHDLSKRHVPRFVLETPEVPVTINNKKVEVPVKMILSGYRVTPSTTLANPESLEFFYQFVDMEDVVGPKEKL